MNMSDYLFVVSTDLLFAMISMKRLSLRANWGPPCGGYIG
jgi:hypothetical protein